MRQGTAVEEGRLAYRVRTAEPGDANALKAAITTTLAHPDQQSRRASYGGAPGRGDILVLERFDRQSHEWNVAGFIECHMRVDDNLSIRDVGTTGDQPQTGVVRYLLEPGIQFVSARGRAGQDPPRRTDWLDIFSSSPGFYREGEEYRRPHYWTIWRWDRQHADEAQRRGAGRRTASSAPRPPQPPAAPHDPPAPPTGSRGAADRALPSAVSVAHAARDVHSHPARVDSQRPALTPRGEVHTHEAAHR